MSRSRRVLSLAAGLTMMICRGVTADAALKRDAREDDVRRTRCEVPLDATADVAR
jgi:hypothetical protein